MEHGHFGSPAIQFQTPSIQIESSKPQFQQPQTCLEKGRPIFWGEDFLIWMFPIIGVPQNG